MPTPLPAGFYPELSRSSYLIPDPDEFDLPRACVHCEADISSLPVAAKQCRSCRDKGMTATFCRNGCGRYVTRTDQKGPPGKRRNVCKPCRLLMDEGEA